MNILSKIFGDPNQKIITSLQPIVDEINVLEKKFEKMNDEELRGMTAKLKQELGIRNQALEEKEEKNKNKNLTQIHNSRFIIPDSILPEAFAVVREAAKRTLGQRHYDAQIMGGIVLHRGQIAEMRTGEGKTLVATLPLYLNALAGKGAQLITVNDYLSRVGTGWMAPIYNFLGLTISVIVHNSAYIYDPKFNDETQYDERLKHFRQIERKQAYQCDITYGTNNEFGFDYLRDNMAPDLETQVQRELHYAIVDEIDSILIDEARTPLIISGQVEESTEKYYKFSQLVKKLEENTDYNVDEKMRAVSLSEAGISKMEKWLGVDNIYVESGISEVHHIEQALKANVLFKIDKDYVAKDNEIIIVDEFTGRLMYGRRYSEGLHQAIEAKEGMKIQKESQTLATITFQNYFRMYHKLAGMTGTAATEAEEFSKIYNLETVIIPTHKPMVRKDLNDLIYRSEHGKFQAVIQDVKARHDKGQPVLIGTISIEKNELLAGMMEKEGLRPQILNAKNHEKEARIIAHAGNYGAITIATNMAGRGVDIVLGDKSDIRHPTSDIRELGGLHVIGTERHESRRIDNQLRGRAGRQGDPGSSQFFVSTEDDLMRIFGGDKIKSLMTTLRVPEDMPIENKMISRSIESAQKKVEGNNFDIRKHLVDYDDVINKHRDAIYRRRQEILVKMQNAKCKMQNAKVDYLSSIILEMIENEIEQVVSFHTAQDEIKDWNLKEIYQTVSTIFLVEEKLKDKLINLTGDGGKLEKANIRTTIIDYLVDLTKNNYQEIKEHFDQAKLNWQDIEKGILIRSIDTLWIEHLDAMNHMRQGIGLRGYGQRDPLVEYKKEAFQLYNELNNLIQKQVVYSIFKVGEIYKLSEHNFKAPNLIDQAKQFNNPAKILENNTSSFSGFQPTQTDKASSTFQTGYNIARDKIKNNTGDKIGRNDPCPCKSGKKFKKCCGR
ncbi:preprotein translocase subunit SecA [Patescibacteria group bacterium]|nr:preprotein translocase subunit SecA [Patescibacteria group bacterium]